MAQSSEVWGSKPLAMAAAADVVVDLIADLVRAGHPIEDGTWLQSDEAFVMAWHGEASGDAVVAAPRLDGRDLRDRLAARCALHELPFSWRLMQRNYEWLDDQGWAIWISRGPCVPGEADVFRVRFEGGPAIHEPPGAGRALQATNDADGGGWPGFDPAPEPTHCKQAAAARLCRLAFDPEHRPPDGRGAPLLLRLVSGLPYDVRDLWRELAEIGWLGPDGWLRRDAGLVVVGGLLVRVPTDPAQGDRLVLRHAGRRHALLRWLFAHDARQVVVIPGHADLQLLHLGAEGAIPPEAWGDDPEALPLVRYLRQQLRDGRLQFAHAVGLPEGECALVSWAGWSAKRVRELVGSRSAAVESVARELHATYRRSLEPSFAAWAGVPPRTTSWTPPAIAAEPNCDELAWVRAGEFPEFPQITANLTRDRLLESFPTGLPARVLAANPGTPLAIGEVDGTARLGLHVSVGAGEVHSGGNSSWSVFGWFGTAAPQTAARVRLLCLPGAEKAGGKAGKEGAWWGSPIVYPLAAPVPGRSVRLSARMVHRQPPGAWVSRDTLPATMTKESAACHLHLDPGIPGWCAPGRHIDVGAFLASARQPGPFYLWNCSCGAPLCDGIRWPVLVRHSADHVHWLIERPVGGDTSSVRWCEVLAFAREQYLTEARGILADLQALVARVPEDPENPDVEWLGGALRWIGGSRQAITSFTLP
jgi:hypothetical protein